LPVNYVMALQLGVSRNSWKKRHNGGGGEGCQKLSKLSWRHEWMTSTTWNFLTIPDPGPGFNWGIEKREHGRVDGRRSKPDGYCLQKWTIGPHLTFLKLGWRNLIQNFFFNIKFNHKWSFKFNPLNTFLDLWLCAKKFLPPFF